MNEYVLPKWLYAHVDRPGATFGVMLHPGHPLMLSTTDIILEKHQNLLKQGTVLLDPSDEGTEPSLLFLLTHEVKAGNDQVISKRLQFVRVKPDGSSHSPVGHHIWIWNLSRSRY
jgi:hypothetical protein